MPDALKKADEVLQQAVQGITDLINVPSIINLDFADVQTVMKDKGVAHIGIGTGKGDDKASEAAKMAVESPLLETTISGATDVILNVSGDISLADASDAADYVRNLTGDDVNVIFGAAYDASIADTCNITIIATGIEEKNARQSTLGFKSGYITPTSLQSKPATGSGLGSFPAAGTGLKPPVGTTPAGGHAVGQAPLKPVNGINKTTDIKSSVEEKSLKIPDFLRSK
jgi:cell division protein FtsZ